MRQQEIDGTAAARRRNDEERRLREAEKRREKSRKAQRTLKSVHRYAELCASGVLTRAEDWA